MLDENDDTTTGSNDQAPESAAAGTAPATAPETPPDTPTAGTDPDPAFAPAPDTTPDTTPAADSAAESDSAPAQEQPAESAESAEAPAPAKKAARKRTTRTTTAKRTSKKAAASDADQPTLPVETPDQPAAAVDALAADAPAEPATETPAAATGPDEDAPAVPRKRTTRKATAKKVAAKKAPAKRATKKSAATAAETAATDPGTADPSVVEPTGPGSEDVDPDVLAALMVGAPDPLADAGTSTEPRADEPSALELDRPATPAVASAAPSLLFKAPDPVSPRTRRRVASTPVPAPAPEDDKDTTDTSDPDVVAESDVAGLQQVPDELGTGADTPDAESDGAGTDDAESSDSDDSADSEDSDGQGGRRRRRRGGRRRRRSGGGDDAESESTGDEQADDQSAGDDDSSGGGGRGSGQRGQRGSRQKQQDQKQDDPKQDGQKASDKRGGDTSGPDDESEADDQSESTGSRRRRRRRRTGEDSDGDQDSQNTVTRVRKPRNAEDEITALHGSTRLEAKKQRRREGREAGRRRAPIVSEAEFLARREAVDRVMVIRQRADLTQIAVLEDQVLVEHYVARESQTSLIGNVYLGRVQNVLPSMEAAFIDIGKGRNAVLYAGEVNWDSLGAGNGPRKIESVLKSGQPILVQVSKDPIGHKGARLTSQISLPGRFLVYVPDGTTSGISRKLPDTERTRLKTLLKEIVPDSAGVIVRTAAEGASEEELTLDVERLTARWADIEAKVEKAKDKSGTGPQLLYGEPDLTLKVVRDLFTEDFAKLVVSGDDAWDMVDTYVKHVAPDLEERLERYSDDAQDVFAAYRIDEQIAKGLDRKVWLPSGGSLIIDRTEAMTVVDVNTGKFTGSGGNLEETVTKNNLEAAEEMIRQLRLRDIGGIIVVDFIDMVLESNRDLVLRRLVECLGRDRTRHQVAEVTSLGLVQMTRKRIGTGLLEAFSENCEHCQGRGLIVHHEPVESNRGGQDDEPRRGRRGRNRSDGPDSSPTASARVPVPARPSPSPKDIAAIAKHDHRPVDEPSRPVEPVETPSPVEPVETTSPVEQPTAGEHAQVERLPSDQPATEAADPVVGPDVSLVAEPVAPVDAPVDAPQPEAVHDRSAHNGSSQNGSGRHESVRGEPAASEPAQPEPEAPPVPKGPILVTSTRRRVARRPAGSATPAPRPDSGAVPVQAPVIVPTSPVLPPTSDGDPQQPAAQAAPVLVTSSRRQVVRRPAGPPVGSTSGAPEAVAAGTPLSDAAHAAVDEQREETGDSDVPSDEPTPDAGDQSEDHSGDQSDGQAEAQADGVPESVHVPVKKKGYRKR